jgi:hypothetical protein
MAADPSLTQLDFCPDEVTPSPSTEVQVTGLKHDVCGACYNTVRTPTLCKPDTSDRPYLFSLSTYLIQQCLYYHMRYALYYLSLFYFHRYLVTYMTPSLYLLRISFIH